MRTLLKFYALAAEESKSKSKSKMTTPLKFHMLAVPFQPLAFSL
ncbi:MAG: hypothetical protein WCK27_09070 [Verrucomicrobiota bacterium]